jgi:hypothetical protein
VELRVKIIKKKIMSFEIRSLTICVSAGNGGSIYQKEVEMNLSERILSNAAIHF